MAAKEKPAKPRPDFPLFAHASGVWAKKINGAMKYSIPRTRQPAKARYRASSRRWERNEDEAQRWSAEIAQGFPAHTSQWAVRQTHQGQDVLLRYGSSTDHR